MFRRGRIASFSKTARFLVVVLLCFTSVSFVRSQVILDVIPVAVSGHWDTKLHLAARGAALQEMVDGTEGYFEFINNSETPIRGAVFYAEYFDAARRSCFSLVFSQTTNTGEKGPIGPNQTREFYSESLGLFPASLPKTMELYMTSQNGAETHSVPDWDVVAHTPVVIVGSIPSDQAHVNFESESRFMAGPVANLLFARVRVDKNGSVTNVDVLDSLGAEATEWFLNFVRKQVVFYPAMEGKIFKDAEALVAVRGILSDAGLRDSFSPPRMLRPVRLYMGRVSGSQLPPISQILLKTSGTPNAATSKDNPAEGGAASARIFELLQWNTNWSSGLGFAEDPSLPHRMRWELMPPQR